MNHPVITVVAGLGRSGTSLMMRMLDLGGLKCFADNARSYETYRALELPDRHDWLVRCLGKAVKLVDPLRYTPPKGYPYAFILMERDAREQARSQVKFLRHERVPVKGGAARDIARSIRIDTPRCRQLLAQRGPVLVVRFEDLLQHPAGVAERVSTFCGGALDVARMAGAVIPRSTECLPFMLEHTLR